jgi:hypothetical protein
VYGAELQPEEGLKVEELEQCVYLHLALAVLAVENESHEELNP